MKKTEKKTLLKELRESIPAYLLIAPTILILLIFLYIPFFNTLRISLYNYKGYGAIEDWAGIENYIDVLTDHKFYSAIWHTFRVIGCDLVFSLLIAFLLSYVLFKGIPLKKFFNTALFIPYLISAVVVACIWRIIYDPNIGLLNGILDMIGLGGLQTAWLSDQSTALNAVTITWIWKTIPFNMLIMYANIMTLPTDYLEAAKLDGATEIQQVRYIILPYMRGTFAQLALLTITNGLRSFDLIWNMTAGGPAGATEVITSYIYRKAFESQRFGVASAASVAMMVMMIVLNLIFNLSKKRGKTNE